MPHHSRGESRRNQNRRLEIESLEPRQLLASVSAGGSISFVEHDVPVILAPWARLGELRAGTSRDLAVNIAGGAGVMDQLSILPSSRVQVSGGNVSYDNVAIGFVATSPASLVVSFYRNATRDSMQAVLRRVAFQAVGDWPSTSQRTVVCELREARPVEYFRYSGEEQLVVRKPEGWQATDRRPAIVLFHGGGWVSGATGQFEHQASHFASLGMVAIAASYRLSQPGTTATPWEAIQDAKSAIRWVRQHAAELGIDPNKIAAGGGSAGGHLAATAGMVEGYDNPGDNLAISSRPQALVLFSAVIDNGPDSFGYDRFASHYEALSPAHNVSRDDPPVVFFHGGQDSVLNAATVDRFHANLDAAGVPATFYRYPLGDHSFFNFGRDNSSYFTETLRRSGDFLASLGWISPAPGMQVPEAYKFQTGSFAAIGQNFKNVNVQAVNDPPQLRLSGKMGYVRDSAAITLAPHASLTDVDSSNLAGGQLRIRIASGASFANRLYAGGKFFVDQSRNVRLNSQIIGTINLWGGHGKTHYVVTFNSSATPAIAQRLIQSMKFRTAGGSAGTRSIEFSLSDGDGGWSATQFKTVIVS